MNARVCVCPCGLTNVWSCACVYMLIEMNGAWPGPRRSINNAFLTLSNHPRTAALMPGGREDIWYLAKSSKLLYKAGWRDKPSSTHPESDCAFTLICVCSA